MNTNRIKLSENAKISLKKIIYLIFTIHLLLFLVFVIIAYIIYGKGGLSMDIIIDIAIGVLSSIVSGVGVSIFIYYKYLKRIPEQTEKKINDLLNTRLSYETTNHNATLSLVDSARKEIQASLQPNNQIIFSKVDDIHLHIVAKQAKQDDAYNNFFSSGERAIIDSVQSLSNFANIMVEMQATINQLYSENKNLKSELKQMKNQQQNNSRFNIRDEELEL